MTPPETSPGVPVVLYAENDENDAFLMNLCWRRAEMSPRLEVVVDGQEAIHYLEGAGPYADRDRFPLPALLLLDLSMPRKSGLEVLAWVRARPEFARLPVLIVSMSNQDKDQSEAARLGADGYFVKPVGMRGFVETIHGWRDRWLADSVVGTTDRADR
jgi:CheY-like chemotaxis protein